tara:strand:- start:63963 stop:64481 length:519 start_codon:yes stop_codon:yes gene_type:complete
MKTMRLLQNLRSFVLDTLRCRNALLVGLLLGLGLTMAMASRADAKTSRKVSHSYEKVWPAAVRFLRIDEGHKVLEKDIDNGYLLFEIAEERKIFQGSVEVIRRKDARGRDSVELILTIKDRPSYMEHGILDRMLAKIQKELGMPKDPEEPEETEPVEEKKKEEEKPEAESAL